MNAHRRHAACLLLLLLSGCSSDTRAPTAKNGPEAPDIRNVIYVGGTTDDALLRLLDVTPKNDPRQTVTFDSPDLSAPVPKGSPATLQFRPASQAARTPGASPMPTNNPSSKWRRGFNEVLEFLAPERLAHAHGVPYNGTAYYLVITDKDSNQLLQLFTAEASFTPEAVDWQHMVDAPQPLTIRITSAFFEDNSIPVDGGPFVAGVFPFRIE